MKSKIYSFLMFFMLFAAIVQAQTTVVLYNGFDNYNGLPATVAPGWYYSYNDTGSTTKSFYNTTGFYGLASPAYKFGFDSITVISPAFAAADSLLFWMKGNGTVKDSNTFEVYTSTDSISWSLALSMDSISPSFSIVSLPLAGSVKHVKFFYRKLVSGYNVGLDDVTILRVGGVGITENNTRSEISIFPSPTSGLVNIILPSAKNTTISVYDLLGNRLKDISLEIVNDKKARLNLSGQKPGLYFLRLQTADGLITRRITLQ